MRVVVNVLSNWTAFIVGTAITFVLSPFVVHTLGDVRYGVWGVIVSIVGYLGLLDLGVRVGVTRFIARHHATGDQDAANRVTTTALGMFAVAGLAAILIATPLAFLLPGLVDIPAHLAAESSIAIAIGGLSVASALLGAVFGGSIAGLQRFALLNTIDVGTELLRAITVWVVLSSGGGLVALSVIQLSAITFRGLMYLTVNGRLQPNLRIARALLDRATLKTIVRFSVSTTILHACALINLSTDALVIAAIMPMAQVTFFMIAGNLAQAGLRVLGGVSRALYPMVSAIQANSGTGGTKRFVRDSMRLGTIIILPILLTFVFRGATFIRLWMGPEYAGPSGRVLVILALGLAVYASYHVLSSNIMALDLHAGLVPAYVGEAVANLLVSIGLGLVLGIDGVALGTTIPRLAVAVAYGPWYTKRTLDLGIGEYAVHAWVRPLASMIPFAVVSVVVDRMWATDGLLLFFAQVILVLPVAALGVWAVGLDGDERRRVHDKLGRALGGMWLSLRRSTGGA